MSAKTIIGRTVYNSGESRVVTIPKEIADRHHLEPGDAVIFEDDGEEIVIRSPEK